MHDRFITEPLPEGTVKRRDIGEAYADLGMIEETLPGMQLSPVIQPTLTLPLKPPPAAAGYGFGYVGAGVGNVALNFSAYGLFNNEVLSRKIVQIYALLINNVSGGLLSYGLRRVDIVTGWTFTAAIPGYSNAGTGAGTALGQILRSDLAVQTGNLLGSFPIPAGELHIIPIELTINNGAFALSPSVVNTGIDAGFFYRTFPIIHQQSSG